MRFARLTLTPDRAEQSLAEWAAAADLDLLQLNYPRPLSLPADRPGAPPYGDFAGAAADQVGTFGKLFYLNPRFRVATGAGWGHAYGCVEAMAGQLVASGNHDVLMSAVRGSNLLPILEELAARGVDLAHAVTGAPFEELRRPIMAADLEIGAGPLAAAVADGARVVVAGCYDSAAPVTAAAAIEFGWGWKDYDYLASAAIAARAVHAPLMSGEINDSLSVDCWRPRRGVLDAHGVAMIGSLGTGRLDAAELGSWLEAKFSGGRRTADVQCDAARLQCEAIGKQDCQISGGVGSVAKPRWKLKVYYLSHFAAETTIAAVHGGEEALLGLLERYFTGFQTADRAVSTEMIRRSEATSMLRIQCRSEDWGRCQELRDEAQGVLRKCGDRLEVFGTSTITAQVAVWPTWAPRNSVDIAVDTRPAVDWL